MFRYLSSLPLARPCLDSHLVGMKHATARDFRITDGVLHEAMAAADADDGEEESQKKAKKRSKVLPDSHASFTHDARRTSSTRTSPTMLQMQIRSSPELARLSSHFNHTHSIFIPFILFFPVSAHIGQSLRTLILSKVVVLKNTKWLGAA